MKALNNADPKLVGVVVALVVVLAGYMVFKSTLNPNNKPAPPIVTGGGGTGSGTTLTLPSGSTGGAPPISTGMPGGAGGMTAPGGVKR